MNHPRTPQIRLPFSVSRPGRTSASTRICGICRKRESKYACPRCNIAYCSLDCFRDQTHVQCSEGFYKETVRESIESDPKASLEERKAMVEMLKRFEEGQQDGQGGIQGLEEEDEEEDDLLAALEGVDLDDIDTNKLFHLLPPAHRDAFLATIRNPESEQAKALVEAAAGDTTRTMQNRDAPNLLPWWEGPDIPDEHDSAIYDTPPELLKDDVLKGIVPPSGSGGKLAYNAIAITLTYLHTLLSFRLPSTAGTQLEQQEVSTDELKEEVIKLVPFLADQKSTLRYAALREAWSSIWEGIGRDAEGALDTSILLRLLNLIPPLLHPPILSGQPPKLLLAISDLYRLFAVPKPGAATPRKLVFYLVALRQMTRQEWLKLEEEMKSEIKKLEGEMGGEKSEADEDLTRPTLTVV